MSKIVINNVIFDFDFGCKVLKLKHKECPDKFETLSSFWDKIQEPTFVEIAQLPNIEQRRVCIDALGLERLIKEVNPKLINSTTLKKSTTWVDENGELKTFEYDDTYELFEVDGSVFSQGLSSWQKIANSYYVSFKDTSTDRRYLLWVEIGDVYRTNLKSHLSIADMINSVDSIMAIAWSITTNVPLGSIEKIVRQGDCILIKTMGEFIPLTQPRHLTKKEYLELIVTES